MLWPKNICANYTHTRRNTGRELHEREKRKGECQPHLKMDCSNRRPMQQTLYLLAYSARPTRNLLVENVRMGVLVIFSPRSPRRQQRDGEKKK